MKLSLVILLTILGTLRSEVTEEEDVLVITTENWNEVVTKEKDVLVEFYAPWCGHCKRLAPEYAKAAGKLKEQGSEAKLAKVDATVEKALAKEHGVRGYPTLKFFKHGRKMEYTGGRKENEIVAWINKKTGPPAKDLASAEEVKKFADSDSAVVIGFFNDKESKLAQQYVMVAGELEDVNFGIASPESSGDLDVKEDKIVVLKKFDDLRADYDGDANYVTIRKFVQSEIRPLVIEFLPNTQKMIFSGDVKIHVFLAMNKKSEEYDEMMKIMGEVAKLHKGRLMFVHLDIDNGGVKRILEYVNVKKDDTPALRILSQVSNPLKYIFTGEEITLESLTAFVDDFLKGALTPFYKSQDVPEDWDKNAVKVLVGKNFEEVVYADDVNVFVEFYAPWCGHCKKLAPIWDELAEKVKDTPNLIITKMDSTENEVKDIAVRSFPTLKFYPANGKVIDYSGNRELDDLIKFLEKQLGDSLKITPTEETKDEEIGKEEKVSEEEKKPADETNETKPPKKEL